MIFRSSNVGSFLNARRFAQYMSPAYKISKTALNSLTVQYAMEYENDGFAFVSVCPGVCFWCLNSFLFVLC